MQVKQRIASDVRKAFTSLCSHPRIRHTFRRTFAMQVKQRIASGVRKAFASLCSHLRTSHTPHLSPSRPPRVALPCTAGVLSNVHKVLANQSSHSHKPYIFLPQLCHAVQAANGQRCAQSHGTHNATAGRVPQGGAQGRVCRSAGASRGAAVVPGCEGPHTRTHTHTDTQL
eukprot:365084-Chlamydomonas_euryale.AAC.7